MRHLIIGTWLVASCSATGLAQEVRYYEQNGITYREARHTVQQPVRDVRYEDRRETYYRQQITTQFQEYSQLSYQPVTTYRWEPRWHGWWRVFRGPHVAYHLMPSTTWQASAQTVKIPITQTQWVPETHIVRHAVPQLRMVEKEQVTRTALGPAAHHTTAANPSMTPSLSFYIPPNQAQVAVSPMPRPSYAGFGGIARLDGDPPRWGTTMHGGSNDRLWR